MKWKYEFVQISDRLWGVKNVTHGRFVMQTEDEAEARAFLKAIRQRSPGNVDNESGPEHYVLKPAKVTRRGQTGYPGGVKKHAT